MTQILVPQCVVARDVGLGLAPQDQGLRGIDPWRSSVLAVDQAVQDVEDVGLGRDAGVQCQFHGTQNGPFVMVQDQLMGWTALPPRSIVVQPAVEGEE